MKNETLYNETVDILVQAYFNDTLVHGNQCGCAVGNIVAANCGIKIYGKESNINWGKSEKVWQDAAWYAYLINANPKDKNGCDYSVRKAKKQIMATGYTFNELYLIEKSFESADGRTDDERMFDGLMKVVDALDEIHENKDELITETSKKKFNRLVAVQECDARKAK